MIFVFESGRLGNQLFQYYFLLSYRKYQENIIFFGFKELNTLLNIETNIYFCKKNFFTKRLLNEKFIKIIIKTKLFNYLCENTNDNKYSLIKHKGFINNITISYENYFQNSILFNDYILTNLNFNNLIYKQSILIFQDLKIPPEKNTCFIHIRRGDYLFYPSVSNPAVLPLEWYLKCIKIILQCNINTFFIFFTDDKKYTKENFLNYPNSIIFNSENPIIDFLLMSQCKSGILSASSFAWWAAYCINLNKTNNHLLAPKFWIGHKTKKWHPQFIESPFLKYIDV